MNDAYVVRRTKQDPPEWIRLTLQQDLLTLTRIPLDRVDERRIAALRVRFVSGEQFLQSLSGRLLKNETTFQLAVGGEKFTVACAPVGDSLGVHVQADDTWGVFSLIPEDQTVAVVDPVSAIAILAIVTIVAIVALTTTAIVVISEAGEEGEVEVRPDPKPDNHN